MLTALLIFLVVTPAYISGEPDTTGTGSGNEWKDFWIVRLILNLLGYATIVIPGYLIISYVRKTGYLDRASKYFLTRSFLYFQF